jgi:hypothetical protein
MLSFSSKPRTTHNTLKYNKLPNVKFLLPKFQKLKMLFQTIREHSGFNEIICKF